MIARTTALMAILSLSLLAGPLPEEHFPVAPNVRVRVDFWKKVYTEVTSKSGFLHDTENLSVIYETVNIAGLSRRARRRTLKKRKRHWKNKIIALSKKSDYSSEEQELFKKLGSPNKKRLREMAHDIRFQRGMKDRYVDGLIRSYLYLDKIKEIIKEHDLPETLAFLPHVESSFNYQAYSKVGAAGIWQFMRSTARHYGLKVNYVVDERRDPLRSADAAIRLLRDNYGKLKTWPLALTAYNHGAASIRRAIRQLGTRDIGVIIDKYEGRRFGFASKNFYATFVAASEIASEPSKYFSQILKATPSESSEIKLDKALTVSQVSKTLGISSARIRELNRALRPVVFRSNIPIPKDYILRIPKSDDAKIQGYETRLAALKSPSRSLAGSLDHIVSRGESVYSIARVYRVSMHDLIMANQISNPRRIRPGMKLIIPGKGGVKVAKKTKVKRIKGDRTRFEKVLSSLHKGKKDEGETFLAVFKDRLLGQKPKPEPRVRDISSSPPNIELKKVAYNSYALTVMPEETIGHYADWAQIQASEIRSFNNRKFGQDIRLGQTLNIPLNETTVIEFNAKRLEYHLAIEEDFFTNYQVNETETYTVAPGDTLGEITRKYSVPFWLLQKYQGKKKISSGLHVGEKITIPVVVPRADPT